MTVTNRPPTLSDTWRGMVDKISAREMTISSAQENFIRHVAHRYGASAVVRHARLLAGGMNAVGQEAQKELARFAKLSKMFARLRRHSEEMER